MGHLILFNQSLLGGQHQHVVADQPDLASLLAQNSSFSGPVWSFVVMSGTWQLFAGADYTDPYGDLYGPGLYEFGNDDITANNPIGSLSQTSQEPTITGDVPAAYVTAFGLTGFRGDHRHFFQDAADFTEPAVDFAGQTSSLVVAQWREDLAVTGVVTLYSETGFNGTAATIGSGAYADLAAYGLTDDSLESLAMVSGPGEAAPVTGDPAFGEIILFENIGFGGNHKHVYTAEPDLGAAEDDSFAALTSSFYVERGAWALCAQPQFQQLMPAWDLSGFGSPFSSGFDWSSVSPPPFFTPGAYPWVEDVGVTNDAVMSLHLPLPDIYVWDTSENTPTHESNTDEFNLWLIFVVGPHAPGGVTFTIASPFYETTTFTDQGGPLTPPGFADLGDFVDATGTVWGSTYCCDVNLSMGSPWTITVACTTEGPYGTSLVSDSLEWFMPAASPPPATTTAPTTVTVPNVVGEFPTSAANVLSSVGLTWTFTPGSFAPWPTGSQVIAQNPASGTIVSVNSSVTLTWAGPGTAVGYSTVDLVNTNTDRTSYDIYTDSGSGWDLAGPDPADGQPFTVPSSGTFPSGALSTSGPWRTVRTRRPTRRTGRSRCSGTRTARRRPTTTTDDDQRGLPRAGPGPVELSARRSPVVAGPPTPDRSGRPPERSGRWPDGPLAG